MGGIGLPFLGMRRRMDPFSTMSGEIGREGVNRQAPVKTLLSLVLYRWLVMMQHQRYVALSLNWCYHSHPQNHIKQNLLQGLFKRFSTCARQTVVKHLDFIQNFIKRIRPVLLTAKDIVVRTVRTRM